MIEPASGLQQPADHLDGGGLPGPVGSEEPVDLSRCHLKADAVDRHALPELLSQVVTAQQSATLPGGFLAGKWWLGRRRRRFGPHGNSLRYP